MDFRCNQSGCSLKALWGCTCNKYFCESHTLAHVSKSKCQIELIEEKCRPIIKIKIEAKNVLREVRSNLIKVSEKMISKVNKCLKENLLLIEEKKANYKNYALSNNIKAMQEIIDWARALNFQNREEISFSLSVVQLLSINNNAINRQVPSEEENKKISDDNWKGKFKAMDIDSKINFMIQNDYESAKLILLDNKEYNKVKLVSLANDEKYIFVCKI
ncbi:hypothetical protein SteCoe_38775 [Stentor coeruleus]|uniref:Uncharacterized protein n=1 Tax=Stentor coeruleus TaxID=5963 RepID=A0A1R2AL50_9CILI|nr:hypothetical protein SteCoe_38775 [Stentor coeruleus]